MEYGVKSKWVVFYNNTYKIPKFEVEKYKGFPRQEELLSFDSEEKAIKTTNQLNEQLSKKIERLKNGE